MKDLRGNAVGETLQSWRDNLHSRLPRPSVTSRLLNRQFGWDRGLCSPEFGQNHLIPFSFAFSNGCLHLTIPELLPGFFQGRGWWPTIDRAMCEIIIEVKLLVFDNCVHRCCSNYQHSAHVMAWFPFCWVYLHHKEIASSQSLLPRPDSKKATSNSQVDKRDSMRTCSVHRALLQLGRTQSELDTLACRCSSLSSASMKGGSTFW